MQCITLRSSCVAPVCTSRRSKRHIVVRASIGDDVLKTFSPSKDNKQPKSGVSSGFSASPKHHGGREPGRQSAKNKPFADGYQSGGQVKLTKEQAEAAAQQQQEEEGDGVAEYLGEAAQKLVNANFDKDKERNTTGSAGWKGDIHDRKKDGFHTRKV